MTNITSISTNATLTFHVLKCEDEKDYMCQCYFDMNGAFIPEKSPTTRISVQATSSKPDSISSIIVQSSKNQTQGYSSSIYKASVSTNTYDILNFRASSIDTVTATHLRSTEKLQLVFHEGDMVVFTCTGDIGRPPGKLIWQKTFPQGKKPITYSNETTYIEEIPGTCTFKGTSHLTVKIYAEDIKAEVRCFEGSQVNAPEMKKDENYYQTFSHDGITVNSEYASVIHTNNTTAGETGDNLVVPIARKETKTKAETSSAFDLAIVYDEVDQQATMKYELSKTDTPEQHDNVNHEVSMESSKHEGKETQYNNSFNFLSDTNKTSVSFEQSQPNVSDWWTVMFTCTGNIGKLPGKLIWQKIYPQQTIYTTFSNETTEIDELPGICSFRGTSNITIKISGEDLKAKIRCYEKSQANVQGINQSELSDNQEDISEDNDYEEIGSVSYEEVDMSNNMIETSNEPIDDGEIVSETIPISACPSSSRSNITMIHFYVNTNIFNTNEHIKMSADNETVSNHPNELGNDNIGIDDTFVNENSESFTIQDHQYVNMTSPIVPNIYEDLNHSTVDTHKYESLNTEGNTTLTE
ncbi:unnamed protein product [Mytilus coruscus]|uniref:CD80-like immunoglobulin C2-set domain-containing protein n=1 Tax=Mytilus coruscus TaxID=42192 RepID=A0A6J8DVU6_MYTCO|nr:unnamed protein product [Mytilus coruscus]